MLLNDVVTDNILIFKKISFSEKKYKYFIGCIDDYEPKSFSIILPTTSAYIKSYNCGTKQTYFLIEDDDSLKKHNDVWNKVSNSIKKEFDSEPIYDIKFLKIKINLTVTRLPIFMIKKFLKQGLFILVQQ